MYQLILDIDGVLVNTDNSYSTAVILTVKQFGGRVRSLNDIFTLRSQGNFNDDYDVTMEFLRQDDIRVDRHEAIKVFQSHYLGPRWEEGVWEGLITREPLLPSPDLLAWLEDKHFSVFTGRPKDEAFFVMRRLGLFDRMQHLVGMHDVTHKKPHPEGIEQIVSLNGYSNVLSCGDTLDDYHAAKSAGVAFVAVLPPNDQAREIMRTAFMVQGCKNMLESINDLPGFIASKENN